MPLRTVRVPGRRRRPGRRMRGRGLADILKKAHAFVKQRRLVSGVLNHFGHSKLAAGARSLGYGRRRRRTTRRVVRAPVGGSRKRRTRRMRGRGFFGDLWNGAKKGFNWIRDNKVISRVASAIPHPMAQRVAGVAGSLGFGRRRPASRRTHTSMHGRGLVRF